MSTPSGYYFRAWRKHRRRTQEDLGAAIGMTASSISQLETGKQGFTDTTLTKLANELGCRPGDLLLWRPEELESFQENESLRKLFDRVARAPEDVQKQIRSYATFLLEEARVTEASPTS